VTEQVASYRRILKSSSIIGGASVINILIGLVRTKIVAVLLGPTGIGLVSLYTGLMATATAVATMGIGTIGTRQIAEALSKDDECAVAVARHFREVEEGWPGGFARKEDEDQAYIAAHPLPDDSLQLSRLQVNGHEVTYCGREAMAFRLNDRGHLTAFAGSDAKDVTVDGRTTVFADKPLPQLAWAPVPKTRRVDGGAVLQVMAHGRGVIRIPRSDLPERIEIVADGPTPGSRGHLVPSHWEDGALVIEITGRESGRSLWGVPVP